MIYNSVCHKRNDIFIYGRFVFDFPIETKYLGISANNVVKAYKCVVVTVYKCNSRIRSVYIRIGLFIVSISKSNYSVNYRSKRLGFISVITAYNNVSYKIYRMRKFVISERSCIIPIEVGNIYSRFFYFPS